MHYGPKPADLRSANLSAPVLVTPYGVVRVSGRPGPSSPGTPQEAHPLLAPLPGLRAHGMMMRDRVPDAPSCGGRSPESLRREVDREIVGLLRQNQRDNE